MSEASSSAMGFADGRLAKGSGRGRLRTADNFEGLNAVKSEAARFLARFPAVFARLRTTSAGEKRVTPSC